MANLIPKQFLATNGSELYVSSQSGEENFNWHKCDAIYYKQYSDITSEATFEPNIEEVYDIYIIPVLVEGTTNEYKIYGRQFLFCAGPASQDTIITITNHDYFIAHLDIETKKFFITKNGSNEKLSFRYRCITSDLGRKNILNQKIVLSAIVDITNTRNIGIRTALLQSENNAVAAGFIRSSNTDQQKEEFFSSWVSSKIEFNLSSTDTKLYNFTIGVDGYEEFNFTYSHASMDNSGKVGDSLFCINLNNSLTDARLQVQYDAVNEKLIFSIRDQNRKISSIAYGYYVI